MNLSGLVAAAKSAFRTLITLNQRVESMQTALGRIELELKQLRGANTPEAFEFQVFSQWGEDGIIQYLLSRLEIPNPVFVEFGVTDYQEANTRFLLVNDNWRGLILDCSDRYIQAVQREDLYWKHDLKAVKAFITRDNINDLIAGAGITGDIGLLSIDIDGNDYWVFEAISCIQPRIIVVEYNSLLGGDAKVSIPYAPEFNRQTAHYSEVYYGASIAAFESLARAKGYALICSNRAGNNLFFVRQDLLKGDLRARTPQEAYRLARFRLTRDRAGRLNYLDPAEALACIHDMPFVDVETGQTRALREMVPALTAGSPSWPATSPR